MFNIVFLRLLHYVIALTSFFRQWFVKIAAFPLNKSDVGGIQSDARKLHKLPLHLGLIVTENEVSYIDIARTILWSATMGITYISLYDADGKICVQLFMPFLWGDWSRSHQTNSHLSQVTPNLVKSLQYVITKDYSERALGI